MLYYVIFSDTLLCSFYILWWVYPKNYIVLYLTIFNIVYYVFKKRNLYNSVFHNVLVFVIWFKLFKMQYSIHNMSYMLIFHGFL